MLLGLPVECPSYKLGVVFFPVLRRKTQSSSHHTCAFDCDALFFFFFVFPQALNRDYDLSNNNNNDNDNITINNNNYYYNNNIIDNNNDDDDDDEIIQLIVT